MAERLSAGPGWDLVKAILSLQPAKRAPAAGTATFMRRDPDGTCWVLLPGAEAETPVNGDVVAAANPGDEVRYETRDGTLTLTGNTTDPAAGVSRASQIAATIVRPVSIAVDTAHGLAKAAEKVANAINQHFWSDDSGIHVTQATQEEWLAGNSGPNVLINSIGQLFRDGLNNLLTMTTESGARALTIWDGAGNLAANVIASFGEVVTIGRSTAAHVDIDTDSMDFKSAAQLLASIIGVNANSVVGGRMLFNGGSKIEGVYSYEGTNYASRDLNLDSGDSSSSVASSVSMRALASGNASDIPYVSVHSSGAITLSPGDSTALTLSKSGVGAVLRALSADMKFIGYDSQIQLRLPSTGTARLRVAGLPSEVNVYDNRITLSDGTFTGYLYPDRVIANGDEGSVSLRIGSVYEGVYADSDSKWIVSKNKSTGDVYLNGHNVSDVDDHKFFAAPSGGGDAYFREIWASDIPSLAVSKIPGIKRGLVGQTNTVTAGSYKDVSVSFGYTYSSNPTVIVGLYSNSTSPHLGSISVSVASVSTTGFTARLFNNSSSDRAPGFYWIAIG